MAFNDSTHSGELRDAELGAFACQRCSRRKQRCDRCTPACSQCIKAGCPCVATERETNVVRSEDNEVQRKGYVRLLEDKIANLEALARANALAVPPRQILNDPRASPPRHDVSGIQSTPRASSPSEPTNINMQMLSLSAMAEPQSRAGEFLRDLSMPRIISAVTETYGGDPETTSRIDILWDGIAKYIRHAGDGSSRHLYFPQQEALKCLQTYVKVVDFRFPRIPVAKVEHGIKAITGGEDSYSSTLASDPAHIFYAYMIMAIVPLVSDIYPVAQGSFVSTHIMSQSLKVLEKVFSKEDGIDIIHCLHLLVIFSMHSSTAGSSWHLIGIAMKKCIALGYHRETPPGLDPDEADGRRWSFWSCYFLDRLVSAALGRPPSIGDRYVTVSQPAQSLSVGNGAPA